MSKGSADNIEQLLSQAQQGDREALDTLVARFYSRVQREVHKRLSHGLRKSKSWIPAAFSTGDIVHDVFINVLGRPIRLSRPTEETVVAYFVRAVQNQLLDMMRYHQAERRDARRKLAPRNLGTDDGDPVDTAAATETGPFRAVSTNEDLEIYTEVLESFNPRERAVLRLHLEHRLTFESIAKDLGYKSADVARKAFRAAKSKLLVRLRSRGVTPETGDGI